MSTLVDITDLIDSATQDLELGQVLFMPNFSLFDAMSAIEIMDPRMDSALAHPGVDPPEVPFTDPNAPLLAEEVCWILDRTMAAEMGWHSGYALSQTLYTSLYIHQLAPVSNHGSFPQYFPAWRQDPARPMALVSIVLQAGLMAIVKTCDWVWRELSGGNVFDLEDFNADKADISLLEGIQIPTVIAELDKALAWLDRWQTVNTVWKYALYHRIALRKHILLSVAVGLTESTITERAAHVSNALASYHSIRAGPAPGTPPPSSPLHAAFDPTINRRLIVSMPLKVIELMPINDAWKALQGMLQGILEICKTIDSADLFDMMVGILSSFGQALTLVQMLLRLRARLPPSPSRSAYVRSLNASLLMSKLTPSARWQNRGESVNPERPVLQLFLSQLLGLSLDDIRAVNNWPAGPGSLPVSPEDLEESAERLLLQHTLCLCHNRPRIRRKMSKSLADWHELWENTIDMAVLVREDPALRRLRRLPLGILHIKLDNVIDLMFAGFETQLYGEAEWPLLYWHLARVLTQQVQTLETLLRLLQEDEEKSLSRTLDYVRSQITYARSLRALSNGTLLTLFAQPPKYLDISVLSRPPTDNEVLLLERRFKWAFGSHSRPTRYMDETRPNLESWMQFASKTQVRQSDEVVREALKEFKEARVHLLSLLDKSIWKVAGGSCDQLMQAFLTGCIKVCNTQVSVLDEPSDNDNDSGKDDRSKWSFEQSSWFPAVCCL
ncbi:Mak10 subunit, NatC N-terminal acetyltransferase-domain-containing protein [Rhizoctonia solani]|nr:Mak10 subunit, NatC N-terminal acetyltransferase-domain-containing protein [Rhizoctonia solani]